MPIKVGGHTTVMSFFSFFSIAMSSFLANTPYCELVVKVVSICLPTDQSFSPTPNPKHNNICDNHIRKITFRISPFRLRFGHLLITLHNTHACAFKSVKD